MALIIYFLIIAGYSKFTFRLQKIKLFIPLHTVLELRALEFNLERWVSG